VDQKASVTHTDRHKRKAALISPFDSLRQAKVSHTIHAAASTALNALKEDYQIMFVVYVGGNVSSSHKLRRMKAFAC